MLKFNEIYLGDCLDVMKLIDTGTVDLIFADLPFQVTHNPKDIQIPMMPLWKEYNRIIKNNGAIVLFGQGMFTADLMMSNKKMWRYNLIYNKGNGVSGFLNANRQPLRVHEDILVFYKKQPTYNPQFTDGEPLHGKGHKYLNKDGVNNNYGYYDTTIPETRKGSTKKYPKSVLNFNRPGPSVILHPTEKPVDLCEYIIRTYTNEDELVLDNTCGVGSTCLAAKNTNRKYIGIEMDEKWFNIAVDRLK
jgi:site-specific DNA-methyltransferase (adenine-specific)